MFLEQKAKCLKQNHQPDLTKPQHKNSFQKKQQIILAKKREAKLMMEIVKFDKIQTKGGIVYEEFRIHRAV
jgi:hypothetical protein